MNPYEVLEISPNASAEEIKAAYHSLAKKWHPDRFMGAEHEAAEHRFRELAEAFSMLKHTERPSAPVPQEMAPAKTDISLAPPVPPAARTAQDWYSEAKTALDSKDLNRAMSLIHYALQMESEKVEFHMLYAQVLDRPGGDVRKLIQTLEHILRLNPKEVDTAIRLAQLYQSVGLSTKATRMWQNVRRVAPNHKVFQQPAKSSAPGSLGEQFTELVDKIKGFFQGLKK